RHGLGSTRAWFDTGLVRHGLGSTRAWFDTGLVRHGLGSTRAWFDTGLVRIRTIFSATDRHLAGSRASSVRLEFEFERYFQAWTGSAQRMLGAELEHAGRKGLGVLIF